MVLFKRGFTLAEALITLTIIGVVSAVSLPTLNAGYKKKVYETSIKKAYNTITNAVNTYMADEGVSDLMEAPAIGDVDKVREFANKYFKVVKDCEGAATPCFADTYYSIDKSNTVDMTARAKYCNSTVLISDGMAICTDAASEKDENGNNNGSFWGASSGCAMAFEVDTNGAEAPNTYGRDWFMMCVKSDGTVWQQGYESGTAVDTTKAQPMPIGYLQENNWKMDY